MGSAGKDQAGHKSVQNVASAGVELCKLKSRSYSRSFSPIGHMITTRRLPSDKPVHISLSLDDLTELNIPDDFIPNVYLQLDQHLQPLQPCLNSKESILVFQQHCRIAEEYHKVRKEIALLQERKKQLIAELDQDEKDQLNATHLTQEYQQLSEENHSLTSYHLQCREHLEKLQVLLQQQQGSS
ncbi:MAP3K7 C-terminal-like protein isoform X1 [Carcharodon carcharias]|uniref:MAP3K7 C-terminal-like protein isoform X1 n=1 Tax=Carcharodon carcharias TaxID=13397 RepID=UPI001B7E784D|nr:MAP3K7 C-terminal-like protein isoform X1 [Carcharodon carcharias]